MTASDLFQINCVRPHGDHSDYWASNAHPYQTRSTCM